MALILNIETATEVCSVALCNNGVVICKRETSDQNSHSELITTFVEEILFETKTKISQIEAIGLSMGPGSYTGLRIGTSTAKGLCYALDIPLIAISTIEAIAFGTIENINNENALYCPMIDARRMEVYSAIFDSKLNQIEPIEANIIDENSFKAILLNRKTYFSGNGAEKCRSILSNYDNAQIVDIKASSTHLAKLSEIKFNKNQFENLAYFEPFYLKDFIAAKSYVKGLY